MIAVFVKTAWKGRIRSDQALPTRATSNPVKVLDVVIPA